MFALYLTTAICFGAIVGSFLNVVIYRLPEGTFLSKGMRSACPKCGVRIAWFDNLPVLGWLLLGGRARCCKAQIAWRYPVVEALTALLFAVMFLESPFPIVERIPIADGSHIYEEVVSYHPGLVAFVFYATFLALLTASTFIDIDHRILPNALNKPGMALGVLGSAIVPGLAGDVPDWGLEPWIASTAYSLLGLLVGGGVTLAIREVARILFRKEAMGFGDVKFMAMIGAFVGWEGAVLTFFLASLFGSIGGTIHRLVTGDAYVPFGPFLAMGAVLSLLYRQPIHDALLVDWPTWVQSSPNASWVAIGLGVLCLILLVGVVRKGRRA